jgi:hypothetical protein
MKKIICALTVLVSVAVISGCDNQPKATDNFSGQWKAVSKSDGTALHPKFSSVMNITCSEAACHIVNKKKSVLSDDELVSNTDWNIKDDNTLMKGNGIASIYIKENKLIASDVMYERQKE